MHKYIVRTLFRFHNSCSRCTWCALILSYLFRVKSYLYIGLLSPTRFWLNCFVVLSSSYRFIIHFSFSSLHTSTRIFIAFRAAFEPSHFDANSVKSQIHCIDCYHKSLLHWFYRLGGDLSCRNSRLIINPIVTTLRSPDAESLED